MDAASATTKRLRQRVWLVMSERLVLLSRRGRDTLVLVVVLFGLVLSARGMLRSSHAPAASARTVRRIARSAGRSVMLTGTTGAMGVVAAWASVAVDLKLPQQARVLASAGRPRIQRTDGTGGTYTIDWGVKLPTHCATFVSVSQPRMGVAVQGGYAIAGTYRSRGDSATTQVTTFSELSRGFAPYPLSFSVAIVCAGPRPGRSLSGHHTARSSIALHTQIRRSRPGRR